MPGLHAAVDAAASSSARSAAPSHASPTDGPERQAMRPRPQQRADERRRSRGPGRRRRARRRSRRRERSRLPPRGVPLSHAARRRAARPAPPRWRSRTSLASSSVSVRSSAPNTRRRPSDTASSPNRASRKTSNTSTCRSSGAPAARAAATSCGRRHARVDDDRDVLQHGRLGRAPGACTTPLRHRRGDAVEVELGDGDAALEVEARGDRRVQLAELAARTRRRPRGCARPGPGVQVRLRQRLDAATRTPRRSSTAPSTPFAMQHVGLVPGAPPGRAAQPPGQHERERPRLVGQPPRTVRRRVIEVRDLEERDVLAADGGGCGATARSRLGTSVERMTAWSAVSGFCSATEPPARVVRRRGRSRSDVVGRHQRDGDRLLQAGAGQRVLDAPPQRPAPASAPPLAARPGQGRPAAARGRGCARPPRRGRSRGVTSKARQDGTVVARAAVDGLRLEAEARQDVAPPRRRRRQAEDAARAGVRSTMRSRCGTCGDHVRACPATGRRVGQLDQQLGGPRASRPARARRRRRGRSGASASVRRPSAWHVRAARRALEVRGLQHHASWCRRRSRSRRRP